MRAAVLWKTGASLWWSWQTFMSSRRWSIRSKVIAVLLLPLLSLSALWAYAADLSLGNALTLAHENTIGNRLARPLGQVIITLRTERRASLEVLAAGSGAAAGGAAVGGSAALRTGRAATDTAIEAFQAQAADGGVRSAEDTEVRQGIDATQQVLAGLARLRQGVDGGLLSSSQVMTDYLTMDQAIGEAFQAMTILPNESAQNFGQNLATLVAGSDLRSEEDDLVSAAAVSPAHRLGPDGYSTFVQAVGASHYLYALATAGLPQAQSAPFQALAAPSGPLGQVMAMEQQVIDAGPNAKSLPFPIAQWRQAYDAQDNTGDQLSIEDISAVFSRTGPPAQHALIALILAGLLGLIALLASIAFSVRIARSLSGDLTRLRESARNLTDDRLRDVVGRLRRGETVDVRGDMARPVFVHREMAQLGDAFHALQLTAVDLAGEDIRLHQGISDIFLNLARRSQVLIHRQLGLLDGMERRAEDPAALEELFRLDQLATRMRRYAEGLIIVSGAAPGRVWRHSVPVVDVVRGAIAETEDFVRVILPPAPPVGIVGHAVADVIHLLAELIENAQTFSPADSQVRVNVGSGASGLVVEIDDRGLGLNPEELAKANARITDFLDISDLDSTRLGLATVGRLAQRHDIKVTLLQSPYGGVTAVVLLPETLLEREAAFTSPAEVRALGTAAAPAPDSGRHRSGPGAAQPQAQAPAPAQQQLQGQPQLQAQPRPRVLHQQQPQAQPPQSVPAQPQRHGGVPTRSALAKVTAMPERPAVPGLFGPATRSLPAQSSPGQPSPGQSSPAQPSSAGRPPAARPQPYLRTPSAQQQPTAPPQPVTQPAPQPVTQAAPTQPSSRTSASPTTPAGHPVDPADLIDGLPRRVRQASIAPHLRENPTGPAAGDGSLLMDWGGSGQGGAAASRWPNWAGRVPSEDQQSYPNQQFGSPPLPLGQAQPAPGYDAPPERADHVRLMMSALQAGAARGRGTPEPEYVPGPYDHYSHDHPQGTDSPR